MRPKLKLNLQKQLLTVCRLEPHLAVPRWALSGSFFTVTRNASELAIVCESRLAPKKIRRHGIWRALVVEGPLDMDLTGVLAAVVCPLADAGVSLFGASTFDSDYVMVLEQDLARAVAVLRRAGHRVAA
jgi:hypothetical protein